MDYHQGYEDAMRQARASRTPGMLGFLTRLILSLLYNAFIYVPLLIVGLLAADKLSPLFSNDIYIKVGMTGIIAYLIFALIYFFKGILVGLRSSRKMSWVFVWLVCVVVTCGIQSIIVQSELMDFFLQRKVANAQIWSLLGAAVVAIVIYSHYQFLTNVAPGSVFWSYQLGFKTSNFGKTKALSNAVPIKSDGYFDNAPMRVSFKR